MRGIFYTDSVVFTRRVTKCIAAFRKQATIVHVYGCLEVAFIGLRTDEICQSFESTILARMEIDLPQTLAI
jgi:hypothetical protein